MTEMQKKMRWPWKGYLHVDIGMSAKFLTLAVSIMVVEVLGDVYNKNF